ncbi:cobalamin adenosyltransferase-domain-containing protein [Tribonema minus]|uniref:Corrinoid adenosyltransferase MMAB n=1 Tax=Tribonema minus TaxID=303371 RepID=A0A835Z8K8_9STRA|nr:cobalamin adenosyltransferase-domain-containing protein [Tribonema minus]
MWRRTVATAVSRAPSVAHPAQRGAASYWVRALSNTPGVPPESPFTFKDIVSRRRETRLKKSLLYTRTGDKGSSSLFSGERRSKADPTFHAIGVTDELNSVTGVARQYCLMAGNGLELLLEDIQSRLLDVGAAIATPRNQSNDIKLAKTVFPAACTMELECAIDELDSKLPKLKTFILPSGGLAATHLHIARVVCRRAERTVVPLLEAGHVDPEVGRYINRLSDFYFAAARYAALAEGTEERMWIHRTDS